MWSADGFHVLVGNSLIEKKEKKYNEKFIGSVLWSHQEDKKICRYEYVHIASW